MNQKRRPDEDPMPDFVSSLEQRLRESALTQGCAEQTTHRSHFPRWAPRLAVPLAASVAVAAVIYAFIASDDTHVTRAYGKPLILRTATVDASVVTHQLQRGLSARLALGTDARLTAARPISAFGGTAYLVTGDTGWCLTAPDPAMSDSQTSDPTRRGAVTCARNADVYRYGIALAVGDNVIAAIPQGVKNPTLTAPDGTSRQLSPSDQGVVVAEREPAGSRLTLYDINEVERVFRLP